MCGICGIINMKGVHSNPSRTNDIEKMLTRLAPRGPDNKGVHTGNFHILGHRRLSIIDLAASAHQPMKNEDGSLILVFNGEIYNFISLRTSLEKKGHIFTTHSDSEVLLHLYEEKKEAMVNDLDGMFAFAIWDVNNRTLFMVRDMFGKKPLYYYKTNDGIIFASEFKSVLSNSLVPRNLDMSSLEKYLFYGYVPAPNTLMQNVFKLPPGSYAVLNKTQFKIVDYTKLSFTPQDNITLESADTIFKTLFHEAVRKRLISDVPLGVFLSGGLDSTAVVCAMSKIDSRRIKSFSIGFTESDYDELKYARLVSKFFATEHNEAIFSPKDVMDTLDSIDLYMDEPIADPSFMPTYLLSKMTRASVTVALSGDGADEVLGGYPIFHAYLLSRYAKYFKYIITPIEKLSSCLPVSHNYMPFEFKLKKFILGLQYPMPARYFIWMDNVSPEEMPLCIKNHHQKNWPHRLWKNIFSLRDLDTTHYSALVYYLYQNTYLPEDILVKTDRCSMSNSLEVRSPFLDKKLSHWINLLPSQYKNNHGKTKILLRRYLSESLPPDLIRRDKQGFSVPLGKWIGGELYDLFRDRFSEEKINREQIFSYQFIRQIFSEHKHRIRNRRKEIWAIFLFQIFYDKYIVGRI